MFQHLSGQKRILAFAVLGITTGVMLGGLLAFLFVYYRAFGTIGGVTVENSRVAFSKISPDMYQVGASIFAAGFFTCILTVIVAATYKPANVYGAAKFATEPQIVRERFGAVLNKKTPQDAEIIWAKLGPPKKKNATYVKTSQFPHGFLAAPTGTGKGVGFVIPNLLHFNGSIICLDVKGENFAKTARYRKSIGDRIIKFSPLDPDSSHCYNPLAEIEALTDSDRQYVELGKIASYFITSKSDNLQSWISGSRQIFAATAMLAIERGNATIGKVKEMLDGASPDVMALYAAEVKNHYARQEFIKQSNAEQKRLNDYINIMNDTGLSAWNNPFVQRTTSRSDFSFLDMRSIPTTIYLVCPEDDIQVVAPLIRLFFQQLSGVLHRKEPDEDEIFNVLFLLDEFDKLGKMDTIIEAYKTIRSYGGRIVVITQSVSQLFDIYGRDAVKGFISNARMRMFAATSDTEAAQLISDIVGDKTHKSKSKSRNQSAGGGGMGLFGGGSTSVKDEALRLIKVQNVTNLDDDKFIIVRNPHDVIVADKIKYYEDAYFKSIFEAQSGPLPLPSCTAPKIIEHSASLAVSVSADAQEAYEGLVEDKEAIQVLGDAEAELAQLALANGEMLDSYEVDEVAIAQAAKAKRRNFRTAS